MAAALVTSGANSDARPTPQTGLSGLILGSQSEFDPKTSPGVRSPIAAIWRVDQQGRPIESVAGYVQLVADHEHVYDGFRALDRKKWSVKTKRLDRANWGDIEAMAALQRVVETWSKRHPKGPRLGVRDISSEFAGYPDFDGDGTSDHVTHQLGMNIDLLFPCRKRPELEIYFGKKNTEHYSLALTRELIDLCIDEGADAFTTTSATRLLDSVEGQKSMKTRFRLERVIERSGAKSYLGIERKVRFLLLAKPTAHGSHINVQFHALP